MTKPRFCDIDSPEVSEIRDILSKLEGAVNAQGQARMAQNSKTAINELTRPKICSFSEKAANIFMGSWCFHSVIHASVN